MRDLTKYSEFAAFLAEAIEPVSAILGDPAVKNALSGGTVAALASAILARHAEEAAAILAAADGVSAEEFKASFTPAAFPEKVKALLGDPVLREVFTSAGLTAAAAVSGSALSNVPAQP